MIDLAVRRIAEKALVRRATRCKPPTRTGPDADYTLAVEMLEFAGPVASRLLGDCGDLAWTTCRVAATAVKRGWLDPRHALRFARDAIESAVRMTAVMEAKGLPLRALPGDPPRGWDHDEEDEPC